MTTYEKSEIQTNKDLTFASGKDTTIAGSTVGDFAKSNLKNKIPTDKQLKEQNDTKEKPKDE